MKEVASPIIHLFMILSILALAGIVLTEFLKFLYIMFQAMAFMLCISLSASTECDQVGQF